MGRDHPPRACYFSIITVFLLLLPSGSLCGRERWIRLHPIHPRIFNNTRTQFAPEDVVLCFFCGSNVTRWNFRRRKLVYEIILLKKTLRNHLHSEHLKWNYASLNVKVNRLTSNSCNKTIKLPKYFICGHSSHVIPLTETIPFFISCTITEFCVTSSGSRQLRAEILSNSWL